MYNTKSKTLYTLLAWFIGNILRQNEKNGEYIAHVGTDNEPPQTAYLQEVGNYKDCRQTTGNLCTCLPGPRGEKGDRGFRGEVGFEGAPAPGNRGDAGVKGQQGKTGLPGVSGIPGDP